MVWIKWGVQLSCLEQGSTGLSSLNVSHCIDFYYWCHCSCILGKTRTPSLCLGFLICEVGRLDKRMTNLSNKIEILFPAIPDYPAWCSGSPICLSKVSHPTCTPLWGPLFLYHVPKAWHPAGFSHRLIPSSLQSYSFTFLDAPSRPLPTWLLHFFQGPD